jgi:hypothetical protein
MTLTRRGDPGTTPQPLWECLKPPWVNAQAFTIAYILALELVRRIVGQDILTVSPFRNIGIDAEYTGCYRKLLWKG